MAISRSSVYAEPELTPSDAAIIDEIKAICVTSPAYWYRRVDAKLRHRGFIVEAHDKLAGWAYGHPKEAPSGGERRVERARRG